MLTKKASLSLFLLLTLFLGGCGKPQIKSIGPNSTILAFGDSLTSGFGVRTNESYPYLLEELIGCEVINSGISGEDTKAGLERLAGELQKHTPDLVVLCFGGNDMLRKQPTAQTISNLRKMIHSIQESGADIILLGVPKPSLILSVPDFYEKLADEHKIPYEGDILKKVLSSASLKSDQIHPNEKGYKLIAESVYQLIKDSEL
ncbi:arylesterase [Puniceicoccaceae bacterium K14]|nr:arylesterase [Puniceicoccaceae bacterium K14]